MNRRYFDINELHHSIKSKIYYNEIRNISAVVIFGHGFGGHKDNRAAERFAENLLSRVKSAAVITFNWPCHGDDVKKKLLLEDCSTYIDIVLEYAAKQFNTDDIYVYATSFGG